MEEITESEAVECNQSNTVAIDVDDAGNHGIDVAATVDDVTESTKKELASKFYKPDYSATILRVPEEDVERYQRDSVEEDVDFAGSDDYQSDSVEEDVDVAWSDGNGWVATVDDLTKSMKDELDSNPYEPAYSATIVRVPDEMREYDKAAYSPTDVSIGPFHRSRQNVQHMEKLKWHYLGKFLDRKPVNDLQMYVQKMKEIEKDARSCYKGNIDMDSDEFVRMMVLDGCFIIQLLLQLEDGFLYEREDGFDLEDPIYCDRWMLPHVAHDMLLLENQLPFSVLRQLWMLTGREEDNLRRSVLKFFRNLLPEEHDLEPPPREVYHIMHLLHSSLIATPGPSKVGLRMRTSAYDFDQAFQRKEIRGGGHLNPHDRLRPLRRLPLIRPNRGSGFSFQMAEIEPPPPPPKTIPTVTELQEAGVKFKRKKAKSFLKIEFKRGLMEIPRLTVSDTTNSLFRNFIAFEQCLPWSSAHFTSYCIFMDSLINTPRDVQLLYRSDIIEHVLGSDEEVAILFNKLCKGITWDYKNSYLANVSEGVIKHSKRKWPKWRAKLVRDYFSNPWAIISFAAAIYVAILASGQTTFAILAYFIPPRS